MATEVTKVEDSAEPSELPGIVMLVSILAVLLVLVLVFV